MEHRKLIIPIAIVICVAVLCLETVAETRVWQRLDEGLFLGEFDPKKKSKIRNQKITVIKVAPEYYSFKLLSASEHGGRSRTAKQWCKEFGLVGAINASMYQRADRLKSTGYMKNYKHINNPYVNRYFGSLMLFNPVGRSLPKVQILDLRNQKNWKNLAKDYNTAVQNYRMITNGQKMGWPQQARIYSTAAISTDRDDNVLFILSRTPYSTHDLIHILLSLPINIKNAMYVEGGRQASLYFRIGEKEINRRGGFEIPYREHEDTGLARTLPNVIGVARRK
jgi:hypothetical protein